MALKLTAIRAYLTVEPSQTAEPSTATRANKTPYKRFPARCGHCKHSMQKLFFTSPVVVLPLALKSPSYEIAKLHDLLGITRVVLC